MNDVFREQLVKKRKSNKDKLMHVGVILATIILSLLGIMYIPSIGVFIVVVLCFIAYIIINRFNVEFEYVFTNGELEIDVIYNKSSRKKKFNGNVKNFEIIAHVQDKNSEHFFSTAVETKDYSSGEITNNTYAFLAVLEGKKTKIIIEPNDEMIKSFSSYISPRLFIKKA